MKPFAASLDIVMMRFALMMGLVIIGVLLQQWWLAFLGLPVFLSAILGVRFAPKTTQKQSAKILPLKPKMEVIKMAS